MLKESHCDGEWVEEERKKMRVKYVISLEKKNRKNIKEQQIQSLYERKYKGTIDAITI